MDVMLQTAERCTETKVTLRKLGIRSAEIQKCFCHVSRLTGCLGYLAKLSSSKEKEKKKFLTPEICTETKITNAFDLRAECATVSTSGTNSPAPGERGE